MAIYLSTRRAERRTSLEPAGRAAFGPGGSEGGGRLERGESGVRAGRRRSGAREVGGGTSAGGTRGGAASAVRAGAGDQGAGVRRRERGLATVRAGPESASRPRPAGRRPQARHRLRTGPAACPVVDGHGPYELLTFVPARRPYGPRAGGHSLRAGGHSLGAGARGPTLAPGRERGGRPRPRGRGRGSHRPRPHPQGAYAAFRAPPRRPYAPSRDPRGTSRVEVKRD